MLANDSRGTGFEPQPYRHPLTCLPSSRNVFAKSLVPYLLNRKTWKLWIRTIRKQAPAMVPQKTMVKTTRAIMIKVKSIFLHVGINILLPNCTVDSVGND